MTFISDIETVTLCDDHSINVSSDLIEPSKGFYLYWTLGDATLATLGRLNVSNVSVSYGSSRSEIEIQLCYVSAVSHKVVIHSDCEIAILNTTSSSSCDNCHYCQSSSSCTFDLASTLPTSCPAFSLTPSFSMISTPLVSPSPSSIINNYSSSSHPTHAPSLTSYSSATTDFSLFPTISPSPLLCAAEDQWSETAAGQNATGTCYKGTFNGQFDHSCYIHYIYLFISY